MRRPDTLIEPEKLLQPYCNRAGTGAYAVDKLSPRLSQKAFHEKASIVKANVVAFTAGCQHITLRRASIRTLS
jgi:hypothetical protein